MYNSKLYLQIKRYCKEHKQTIRYRGKTYYLYQNTIYDSKMNVIIEDAGNGFLDLFEYYEYFPQNEGGIT